VSRPLAHVVARTLAKKPEARPASAAELRSLLEAALRGELPSGSGPIEVTADSADSDAEKHVPATRTISNRSPVAFDETLQKPKTRPPIGPEMVSSATAAPTTTVEAAARVRRARWPLRVLLFAVAGAIAAVVVTQVGGGRPTTDDGAGSEMIIVDAAAVTPAIVIDAALVDAGEIVDAGVPVPIDAGKRRSDDREERRKKIDAGPGGSTNVVTPPPPPPPKVDAGATHPWDDPN
jgi:hypothetical protein